MLKIGDRVRYDRSAGPHGTQPHNSTGKVVGHKLGSVQVKWDSGEIVWHSPRYIQKIEQKENEMNNFKKGDVLVGRSSEMEVVAKSHIYQGAQRLTVYVTREEYDDDLEVYTPEELQADGYKLKKDVKEMTVKEISDKLGYEVKVVEG